MEMPQVWDSTARANHHQGEDMRRLLSIAAIVVVVTACGGGGGSGSGGAGPGDAEGIYTGNFGNAPVTIIIDSKGNASFLEPNNLRVGNFSISNDSATFQSVFCDRSSPTGYGGQQQTLTLTGAGSALSGSITDPSQGSQPLTFSLTAQTALYDTTPSLASLAGTYTTSALNCAAGTGGNSTSFMLTFDAAGNMTGSDSYVGCTYAGTVSIPVSAKNAYEIHETATCHGTSQTTDSVMYLTPATSGSPANLFFAAFNGVGAFANSAFVKQ